VNILLYEIFHFYIQIRSVYNCFNQYALSESNRIRYKLRLKLEFL